MNQNTNERRRRLLSWSPTLEQEDHPRRVRIRIINEHDTPTSATSYHNSALQSSLRRREFNDHNASIEVEDHHHRNPPLDTEADTIMHLLHDVTYLTDDSLSSNESRNESYSYDSIDSCESESEYSDDNTSWEADIVDYHSDFLSNDSTNTTSSHEEENERDTPFSTNFHTTPTLSNFIEPFTTTDHHPDMILTSYINNIFSSVIHQELEKCSSNLDFGCITKDHECSDLRTCGCIGIKFNDFLSNDPTSFKKLENLEQFIEEEEEEDINYEAEEDISLFEERNKADLILLKWLKKLRDWYNEKVQLEIEREKKSLENYLGYPFRTLRATKEHSVVHHHEVFNYDRVLNTFLNLKTMTREEVIKSLSLCKEFLQKENFHVDLNIQLVNMFQSKYGVDFNFLFPNKNLDLVSHHQGIRAIYSGQIDWNYNLEKSKRLFLNLEIFKPPFNSTDFFDKKNLFLGITENERLLSFHFAPQHTVYLNILSRRFSDASWTRIPKEIFFHQDRSFPPRASFIDTAGSLATHPESETLSVFMREFLRRRGGFSRLDHRRDDAFLDLLELEHFHRNDSARLLCKCKSFEWYLTQLSEITNVQLDVSLMDEESDIESFTDDTKFESFNNITSYFDLRKFSEDDYHPLFERWKPSLPFYGYCSVLFHFFSRHNELAILKRHLNRPIDLSLLGKHFDLILEKVEKWNHFAELLKKDAMLIPLSGIHPSYHENKLLWNEVLALIHGFAKRETNRNSGHHEDKIEIPTIPSLEWISPSCSSMESTSSLLLPNSFTQAEHIAYYIKSIVEASMKAKRYLHYTYKYKGLHRCLNKTIIEWSTRLSHLEFQLQLLEFFLDGSIIFEDNAPLFPPPDNRALNQLSKDAQMRLFVLSQMIYFEVFQVINYINRQIKVIKSYIESCLQFRVKLYHLNFTTCYTSTSQNRFWKGKHYSGKLFKNSTDEFDDYFTFWNPFYDTGKVWENENFFSGHDGGGLYKDGSSKRSNMDHYQLASFSYFWKKPFYTSNGSGSRFDCLKSPNDIASVIYPEHHPRYYFPSCKCSHKIHIKSIR